MFSEMLEHVGRLITSGRLDEASSYLLEKAAFISDEYAKEADQLALFSEHLVAVGKENKKIIKSLNSSRSSEIELDKDIQRYKEKLEVYLEYISDMEALGEPVLYRGGVSRHPLGPDHFCEIKKVIESEGFDDYVLHEEFLDKLKGQVAYYDFMTPFDNRTVLVVGRRKGVVSQGKYHEYLVLKKKKPSIEKLIDDLKRKASYILKKIEKFYENKELSVQYFWVESGLGRELKFLEQRLIDSDQYYD